MKLIFENRRAQNIKLRMVNYAIAALLISLAHVMLIDFISIGNITPDLLLILVVWISLREGQFIGIFAGFIIGFLFDLLSYDALFGTNSLAKTVAAFIAGYFFIQGKSEQLLASVKFVWVTFIAAVVHNLIYFFFYLKFSEISFAGFFFRYGIAMSIYTTVFATVVMLVKSTRRNL
ncbi:MAG: rod shape-determining protein MreD [Candidatus Kapabacteria bacterium]|nr:rod shape-determining protein MreD [Candidatus Kapabacteria bacterium]